MLRKINQRLSDPIFYRRRWSLFRNRFRNIDFRERSLDELPHERVHVVVAHPDDEVFCSGTICELTRRPGTEVRVLCLTRGEGGPLPDGVIRSELGELRESEMQEACRILGVSQLRFLDHEDPVGDEFRTYAPDVTRHELENQLRPYLRRFETDLVITHGSWGEYWHPGHLLLHSAVKYAARNRSVLTFQANQENPPIAEITNLADPPHLKFDFTCHHERRLAALEAHQSQLELFGEFANGTHTDFVKQTAREHLSVANFQRKNFSVSAAE